jgi:hypothetical protein
MAGMNNDFYTFKDGKVWKHHSNATRNNYYGTQYNSVMQTIFNVEADSPKMFKTLKLKGKSVEAWSADIVSDLNTGLVTNTDYEKKEGNWYGYIRRDAGDLDLTYLSTQGLGLVAATATIGDEVQINITGDVTKGVTSKTVASVGPPAVAAQDNGDLLFAATVSGQSITAVGSKLGQVKTISYNPNTNLTTINMVKHPEAPGAPTPPAIGRLMIAAKNSQAESFGLRGAYMDVTLTNTESEEVELLAVASEVFKSYQ